MTPEQIFTLTLNARDKVRRVLAQEPDPAGYALWVEVSGVSRGAYEHRLRIAPLAEAGPDHLIQADDDLSIVVPAGDVEKVRGSTITIDGDPLYGRVVVVNPNPVVSPAIPVVGGELGGDVAQRVAQVLELTVNPAIAMHGGRAELVAVEGDTAYLRLSGGCQGCGMARVTLSQGIEVAIREAVPEIVNLVDVTDHASGSDPYYESAKK